MTSRVTFKALLTTDPEEMGEGRRKPLDRELLSQRVDVNGTARWVLKRLSDRKFKLSGQPHRVVIQECPIGRFWSYSELARFVRDLGLSRKKLRSVVPVRSIGHETFTLGSNPPE
jgi:hypothetical protein